MSEKTANLSPEKQQLKLEGRNRWREILGKAPIPTFEAMVSQDKAFDDARAAESKQ